MNGFFIGLGLPSILVLFVIVVIDPIKALLTVAAFVCFAVALCCAYMCYKLIRMGPTRYGHYVRSLSADRKRFSIKSTSKGLIVNE